MAPKARRFPPRSQHSWSLFSADVRPRPRRRCEIEDEKLRRTLRDTLLELNLPRGLGFIVRTAGQDRTKKELSRRMSYLLRLWKAIASRLKTSQGPGGIYEESDMIIRTIRDIFTATSIRSSSIIPKLTNGPKNFWTRHAPACRPLAVLPWSRAAIPQIQARTRDCANLQTASAAPRRRFDRYSIKPSRWSPLTSTAVTSAPKTTPKIPPSASTSPPRKRSPANPRFA